MKSTLRAARPGFTLIEIMVATAISVFLVVGVVQIASSSINAYNNAMSMVATTAVSRQVLDTLESDIQSAILRNDGNVWMECVSETTPGNFDAGACQALYLFSTPADRDRFKPGATGAGRDPYAGDVCAVRYRVDNKNPLPDVLNNGDSTRDRVYTLNRLIVNSEDTFKNILTKVTGDSNSTPSGAINTGTRPGTGGGSYAQNRPADIFGMNVVGLTPVFIFKKTQPAQTGQASSWYFYAYPDSPQNNIFYPKYFTDGFGSETSATDKTPLRFKTLQISAGKYFVSQGATTKKPDDKDWKDATLAAVLISATIVDDVGADMIRIAQQRSGNEKISDAEWAQIIQAHGRTYVRRINIPGAN